MHVRESAPEMRALLARGAVPPAVFRAALAAAADRDAWLDAVLGLDPPPPDEPSLPRGCVPYLPAPADRLLEVAEVVGAADTFVDIGSGIGRATLAIHLLTGATAIGVEIQPSLAATARAHAARLGLARVSVIEGDAARADLAAGTVFFLYCPFSGDRLHAVLASLESLARPIRVCCLDLPLPSAPWLALAAQPSRGLDIYRRG